MATASRWHWLACLLLLSTLRASVCQNETLCTACAKVSSYTLDAAEDSADALTNGAASIESLDYEPEADLERKSMQELVDSEIFSTNQTAESSSDQTTGNHSTLQDLVTPLGAKAVLYWNAPLSEFEEAPNITITSDGASIESGVVTVAGKTISDGYMLPDSKQGVNDQRFFTSKGITASTPAARTSRYAALMKNVSPGVRRYNVFWHLFESSSTLASTSASLVCPSGYVKVPATAAQMSQLKMSAYHCYQYSFVYDLDSYLALDAANGIESAAVMWGSPAAYVNPDCTGNKNNGKIGCVPRADAVPAWKDFAIFLTSRWKGGSAGRFTHFIVWNEVDSPSWYDMTPEVNDTLQHIENTPQAAVYMSRLVAMMRAVHEAVQVNLGGQPSMLWVPLTRMWTASPWCPGPKWGRRCNFGAVNVLTQLWNMVGTSMDWSVALHPYGIPTKSDWGLTQPYQAYTFGDLPKVRDFQIAKAKQWAVPNPTTAPQAMLAATEQGWTTDSAASEAVAAQYICASHAIATNAGSNIVWVAHNDAQDVYAPYSGSYGLMSLADGPSLSPATPSTTLQAYRATSINVWSRDGSNYCCKNFQQGCP